VSKDPACALNLDSKVFASGTSALENLSGLWQVAVVTERPAAAAGRSLSSFSLADILWCSSPIHPDQKSKLLISEVVEFFICDVVISYRDDYALARALASPPFVGGPGFHLVSHRLIDRFSIFSLVQPCRIRSLASRIVSRVFTG